MPSQDEVMAATFNKYIESCNPEQLVRAMLDLIIMKPQFKSQDLYTCLFRAMALKLVVKIGVP